jgi:DinB superfamily
VSEREALLDRFAAFPGRLGDAARAARGRPVPEGEWSPSEVVSHLIAVEEVVWRARLRDLEGTDDPQWSRTEPGLATGLDDATLDDVLAAFEAARAGTVAVVRALDDAGWARSGTHEVYGRLDVAGLLGVAIDHDKEHLDGLARTPPQ